MFTDQQVCGAGTSSLFAIQAAEDESLLLRRRQQWHHSANPRFRPRRRHRVPRSWWPRRKCRTSAAGEGIDFARLGKLNLDIQEAEDLSRHGLLQAYNRDWDKQPGSKAAERRLAVLDRAAYNVSTSSDPVIADLAERGEATVFATDAILSTLMCAPRSVYS